MREYEILSGVNKGTYIIYDNVSEATEYLGSQPIKKWKESDIKDKDWVQTDDGRVVQVIKVYSLSNSGTNNRYSYSKKTGNWIGTRSIKVCFGVFTIYGKANGTLVTNKMLAEPYRMEDFHKNRSSITPRETILGKYLTKRKKIFCMILFYTGNPIYALNQTLNKNRPMIAKNSLVHNSIELLKDEYVIKELKTYMKTEEESKSFKERMVGAFEAEDLDIKRFAAELNEGLITSKKGGLAHKQWVEMLGKIVTYLHEDKKEKDLLGDGKPFSKEINTVQSNQPMLLPPSD